MKTKPANVSSSNPKLAEKRRKTLIKAAVGSVAGIAVIALGIAFVPRLWGIGVSAASVTTYEVEAITYGNVDTTISGSGNLTPCLSANDGSGAAGHSDGGELCRRG